MAWVAKIVRELRMLISQPTREMTKAQRSARFLWDLGVYASRTLRQHRAGQMAAALTYRTIFSLVPLLVLAMLLINALGGFKHFGNTLQDKAYDYFGITAITEAGANVKLGNGNGETDDNGEVVDDSQPTIATAIEDIKSNLNQAIKQISFKSIGAVGAAVLIWAALALVVTIEHCFNTIYSAPSGRSWSRRLTVYWSAITLAPLLLLISLSLTNLVVGWLSRLPLIGSTVGFISPVTALLASWVLFFTMYALLPNARVKRREALIGSFIAAIAWEISKWGFAYVVKLFVQYAALYASLALLPLFMLWLYVNWLIVLFGLEITYTLQTLPDFQRRNKEKQDENRIAGDPMWLIPIMAAAAEAFRGGGTVDRQQLAEQLDLPLRSVVQFTSMLSTMGYLHVVGTEGDDERYALARPPQQVEVAELLGLARAMQCGADADVNASGWRYLSQLADTQQRHAADATLATIIHKE